MPNSSLTYIQYAWNKSSHIRVAGIVRNMTYENLVAQRPSLRPDGRVCRLYVQCDEQAELLRSATYVRGISQFLNDIHNLDVDLVPDREAKGKMQVLPMMGWYAGLQYKYHRRRYRLQHL